MFDKIFKVLLIALLSFIAYTLHTYRMNTKYFYSVLNDTAKEFSIKKHSTMYQDLKESFDKFSTSKLGENTRDLLESLEKSEDSQAKQ